MTTSGSPADPHRQQRLYWAEMTHLKAATAYMRLYRDSLGRWIASLGALRAVASSGSIAAWAVWHDQAYLWGAIIAAAQLADALKEVFPFTRRSKAVSQCVATFDLLFVDAQLEWEMILSGERSDDQIVKRLHELRRLRMEAENRNFPEGLAVRPALMQRAQTEVEDYFKSIYG